MRTVISTSVAFKPKMLEELENEANKWDMSRSAMINIILQERYTGMKGGFTKCLIKEENEQKHN